VFLLFAADFPFSCNGKKFSFANGVLSEHDPAAVREVYVCLLLRSNGCKLDDAGLCTGGRVQSVCAVGFFLFFSSSLHQLVIQLIPFCHWRNVLCRKSSRAGGDNENRSPAGSVTFEIKDQRWR